MIQNKTLRSVVAWAVPKVSWISWNSLKALFNGGVFFDLQEKDWDNIQKFIATNHYIILTRNSSHLSTYFVAFGNLFARGQWGFWGHALMNVEEDDDPNIDTGYRLVEATGTGVHYSSFFEVFSCDAVALLKPKDVTDKEWFGIMQAAKKEIGKPYDNLMDLMSDNNVNCVELVRIGLKALPNYEKRFANLEKMIAEEGLNLTPDMLYNCSDFETVLEIRR